VGGILGISSRWGASHCRVELPALRFPRRCPDAAVFTGVVSGIAHYGNCVGVPTVGGEVYLTQPTLATLVNVMALGLMETEEIVKSGADGLGNPVLYVGSTTGEMGWRR